MMLSHFGSLVQAEELNLSFSFWKLKLEEHIPLMPFQKDISNTSPAKGSILMFCKENLWQNHIADSQGEGAAIT